MDITLKRGLLLLLTLLLCACGKKGPPLAPLNLVPEPPSSIAARRVGDTLYVEMHAPAKNANGPGLVALDHVEIYGVTVGPGFVMPPNRELLTQTYLVGRIEVKPPPDDEQPVEDSEADPRPAPGDKITFSETLTAKLLESAPGLKPLPPAPPVLPVTALTIMPGETVPVAEPATSGAGVTPGSVATVEGLPAAATASSAPAAAATEQPAVAPQPTGPVRVYLLRGVTRKGRPGPPSARLTIPLAPPPPPPGAATATFTERAVTLTWVAPVPPVGEAPALAFNVYGVLIPGQKPATAATAPTGGTPAAAIPPATPLNDAPISGLTFERVGAPAGVEQCFQIRTVERVGDIAIESDPTAPVCVTPKDIFPPAPPKGLALVAMEGGIMNLIWDANTEPDLDGYIVLRGEAPGDTLQPLSPAPIHDTKLTDTTVKPGVRYVYAVIAVDRARNRSAPSTRVEETAR